MTRRAAATDPHQETDNAAKWERTGLEGRLLARFRARVLAELSPLRPATILDAGCGEGTITGWLASALPAARVAGLELRGDAIADFRANNPTLTILTGDICAIPAQDRSYDVVTAIEVLEHLDDPRRALRELRRVARVAVVVTVPLEPWFRAGNVARGRHLRRLGSTPGHQSTWGPAGFRRIVRAELGSARWFEAFPWQGAVARRGSR